MDKFRYCSVQPKGMKEEKDLEAADKIIKNEGNGVFRDYESTKYFS